MNKFCVASPVFSTLDPKTEASLVALRQALGDYNFYQERGCSDIYRARCKLANLCLNAGEQNILWVDSGHVFTPEQATAILEPVMADEAELCCGVYSNRSGTALSFKGLPGRRTVLMDGHLEPIAGTGFGFTATSAKAFEMIAKDVPVVKHWGRAYFFPVLYPAPSPDTAGESIWLGEDLSFCHRLMAAGGTQLLHTGVWPGHVTSVEMQWWHFLNRQLEEGAEPFEIDLGEDSAASSAPADAAAVSLGSASAQPPLVSD